MATDEFARHDMKFKSVKERQEEIARANTRKPTSLDLEYAEEMSRRVAEETERTIFGLPPVLYCNYTRTTTTRV